MTYLIEMRGFGRSSVKDKSPLPQQLALFPGFFVRNISSYGYERIESCRSWCFGICNRKL